MWCCLEEDVAVVVVVRKGLVGRTWREGVRQQT